MKSISLIAHDGKKPEMVSFVNKNRNILEKCYVFTTGTTGKFIELEGFEVTKLLSGPRGGDAQIAAMIAEGKLDAVIFFRDPLEKHPHEPDVQMLLRLADVYNIPLATNPRAGQFILWGIEREMGLVSIK
jgi:methylglyoxal synthase